MPNEEEPAITFRQGLSRSPIRWAVVLVRFSAFVFMFWLAGMVVMHDSPCGGGIALLVLQVFFARFLTDTFGIDRSTYRFFDDRLDVDYRPGKWGAKREHRVHAYDEIGHIELASLRLVRIFITPKNGQPYVAELAMDPRSGEDYFDELADHLQGAAPDHLFSIYEDGHVRFSRECSFAQLFPDHMTGVESVRVHGRKISAGEHVYAHDLPDVFELFDGEPATLFRATPAHVLTAESLVLGSIQVARYREIKILLFDEDEFTIDGQSGAVSCNDHPVGEITAAADEQQLTLNTPLPTIVALIVLMAYTVNRAQLRL